MMADATLIGFKVVSTLLLDASVTVLCTTASEFVMPTATMTTNRSITLGTTSAVIGEALRIVRLDKTAFTLTVINGGPAGGSLIVLPVSVARVCDFVFDGVNWILSGVVRLT